MTIDIQNILTWIGMAGGLIGVWFRNQYKIERLEEKDSEQAKEIADVWNWKNIHERDSFEMREKFNKETAELRGRLDVTNEQFRQIMVFLQDLKERMIKLENK